MSQDLKTLTRQDFVHFMAIPTRWMDNDVYGHVNNVNYYSYFDTVVNQYLIEQGVLDIQKSPVVGLVVQTGCSYFASIAFPDLIHAGLRVTKLGNSSVRYEVGLFKNEDQQVSAAGHFIHVYVDRQTQRPISLPEPLRAVLQQIYIPA